MFRNNNTGFASPSFTTYPSAISWLNSNGFAGANASMTINQLQTLLNPTYPSYNSTNDLVITWHSAPCINTTNTLPPIQC
jgi:hypothetical protein